MRANFKIMSHNLTKVTQKILSKPSWIQLINATSV